MMQENTISYRLPVLAIAGLLLIGVTGIVFYGWLLYGSSILLTLGEGGISWCL